MTRRCLPSVSFVLATISLASCSFAPSTKLIDVGDSNVVVASAGAGFTITKAVGGKEIMCVRLGPDATSDTDVDVNLGFVIGRSGSDQAGSSQGDQEIELIGRTPVNVLARDMLYQICIMRQSELITDAQYQDYFSRILNQTFKLSLEELKVLNLDIKSQSAGAAPAPTRSRLGSFIPQTQVSSSIIPPSSSTQAPPPPPPPAPPPPS